MQIYIVIILQFFIWSGYTFIEWLSKHDQLFYKAMMFWVFYYLAFLLGRKITESASKSLFLTFFSLAMYCSLHYTMAYFLPHH